MSKSSFDRWLGDDDPTDMTVEAIDAPTLPKATDLLAFYLSLRDGQEMPRRADIDPLTIPKDLLASVYLLEPIAGGKDWVYRLIGSGIVERFRTDRTGDNLRRFLPPDSAEDLVARSNQIAEAGLPVAFRLFSHGTVMDDFYAETLSLPVLDQKSGRVWLFGGTFFGSVARS